MSGPRLLFRVRNRRGLGHWMRATNLARAILELRSDARVHIHASHAPPAVPGAAFTWSAGMSEGDWDAICTRFAPDLVVHDTILPPETSGGRAAPRLAFVMRRVREDRVGELLAHPALDRMVGILVPHTREEWPVDLPRSLRGRVRFVGPVVRLPSSDARSRVRAELGISEEAFLLCSTAGGGGFESSERLFRAALLAEERLRESGFDHHHLVVAGPNFGGFLPDGSGRTVRRFLPALVDALAAADAVVCEGGYNTVAEILAAQVPALVVPAPRGLDDQCVRARGLADRGLARVCTPKETDPRSAEIAAFCRDHRLLASLRTRLARHGGFPGNRAAAACLLGWAE